MFQFSNPTKPESVPTVPLKPKTFGQKSHDFMISVLTIITFSVVIIFFFVICVPLYLYRILIFYASRTFRPDLDRMLTPQSSIMATDAIYSNPECAFVLKFVLDGQICKSDLESRLKTAISQEIFSELTQSLEKWMGFFFWKKMSENNDFPFSLENHIQLNNDSVTMEEIKEIHTALTRQSFKENIPLWECVAYNNVKPEKELLRDDANKQSVVFIRIHSALTDGKCFFQIFDELKMVPEYQSMINAFVNGKKKMKLKEKIKFGLRICILGPYNIIYEFLKSKLSSKFHHVNANFINIASMNLPKTNDVSLPNAKRIAMCSMSPTAGLIVALISGAIRRIFLNEDENEDLSEQNCKINCVMPIPLTTDRLSNFVAYIPVDVPLKEEEPMTRLTKLLGGAADMISSTIPYTAFGLTILAGSLPTFLISFCSKKLPLGSIMLNNFPATNMKRTLLGKDVTEISVKSGCPKNLASTWCIVNTITYKGDVNVSVTCRKDLEIRDQLFEEFKLCESPKSNSNSLFGNLLNGFSKF